MANETADTCVYVCRLASFQVQVLQLVSIVRWGNIQTRTEAQSVHHVLQAFTLKCLGHPPARPAQLENSLIQRAVLRAQTVSFVRQASTVLQGPKAVHRVSMVRVRRREVLRSPTAFVLKVIQDQPVEHVLYGQSSRILHSNPLQPG